MTHNTNGSKDSQLGIPPGSQGLSSRIKDKESFFPSKSVPHCPVKLLVQQLKDTGKPAEDEEVVGILTLSAKGSRCAVPRPAEPVPAQGQLALATGCTEAESSRGPASSRMAHLQA